MINEDMLKDSNNVLSQDRVRFMYSLFASLHSLKEDANIDDVYLYPNLNKIEIYIFTFDENFQTEDFITSTMTKWEQMENYFPEIYINQSSDKKINILPRKALKIC